ncbi:hypothetical protein [Saccharothrix australiensis]|uniref:Universal stress protein family protein n=1 Tax=Saccharothrix australiensis TaxID=2072 RepID=A0A495VZM1_9PSEU|nr:hypothetical protein [Saccharothrix australiensis]RKT54796.1 hypothetical protein C8E97_3445 [Saccharothrix australiensis]
MSKVIAAEPVGWLPRQRGARRTTRAVAVGEDGTPATRRAAAWAERYAAVMGVELVSVPPEELRTVDCAMLVVGPHGEPFRPRGYAAAAENPERALVVVRGLPEPRTGVVTAAVGGAADTGVLSAAAAFCRASGARLRVLHVHHNFGGVAESAEPDDAPLRRALAFLEVVAADLTPAVVLDGREPHDVLAAPVSDLVVVGRGPAGGLGRMARTALYHSACPVLIP